MPGPSASQWQDMRCVCKLGGKGIRWWLCGMVMTAVDGVLQVRRKLGRLSRASKQERGST
jgi:hypothetical protein